MTANISESSPELPPGAALFLDFDGTLVELAETPDGIVVPGSLRALLRALSARLEGRVAIVSGRALDDLDGHVGMPDMPMAGSHGLEIRAFGAAPGAVVPAGLAAARERIVQFAGGRAGLLVEKKPVSIALHFRQAPALEGEVLGFLRALARESGLELLQGKMVGELRPAGGKGDAVRFLMAQPPFAGSRPIFIGDDVTDEDGFEAAEALGGFGILVGPARSSAARFRLAGVAATAAWLKEALQA